MLERSAWHVYAIEAWRRVAFFSELYGLEWITGKNREEERGKKEKKKKRRKENKKRNSPSAVHPLKHARGDQAAAQYLIVEPLSARRV